MMGRIFAIRRSGAHLARRFTRSLLLAAACVAALVLAVSASAQAPQPAGVAKAKMAGIIVDPDAEAAMAAAPLGSCYNDPTQRKCPKAARVAAPTAGSAGGDLTYAPLPGPGSAALATTSAAAVDQCYVKADPPYFAAGYAQGNGANTCTNAVSRQELYVTLYDYISSGRRQLDTRASAKNGGGTLTGQPTFNCDHPVSTRQYEVQSEGYALLQGTWYAATQNKFASFKCPY